MANLPVLNQIHKIGQLDREIEIWRKTESRTDTGAVRVTNTSLGTFWAYVDYGSGTGIDEKEDAGKLVEFQKTSFVIRYYSDLTPKDYITYEGETYDIRGIIEQGRKRFLKIITERRA